MRKLILLVSLVLSFNAFGQIPTNGLVGYWPFNGNANDESGAGNNGIVSGATLTTDRFENINSAYNFDASSNSIIINYATPLNTSTFTGITISAWCKINDLVLPHNILSLLDENLVGFTMSYDYSAKKIYAIKQQNNQINTLNVVESNRWYNLVLVFDATTNVSKFYLNNIFQGEIQNNNSMPLVTKLYIGLHNSETWGIGWYMNGSIDDIRIYNRNLTDSEISSLFNEGICKTSITITDTLVINANITGFNPINYANTIKVYPNPTKDAITINCGNNYDSLNGYTIKITNSLSQTVYTAKVYQQSTSIKLNDWTGKGIYFVHLIDASSNTIDIKKIVLQ